MKTFYKKIVLTFSLILCSMLGNGLYAQSTSASTQDSLLMLVLGLVLLVAILVLIVAMYMVMVLKTILGKEEAKQAAAEGKEVKEKKSLWAQLDEKLTGAVPLEKEEDVMLDHDYDGIKELDNHLPPWWLAMFYITIILGVVYIFSYHVFDVFPLQEEEYAMELEEAEATLAALEESGDVETIDIENPEQSTDADVIASGQQIFSFNCASCHAPDGGGKPSLGPNLTDNYWLHGGEFKNIFNTIHEGVSGTSMIAWKNSLSPVQVRDVASYVMTLIGTTPANPKDPEGELFAPEGASPAPEEEAAVSDSTEAVVSEDSVSNN